MKFIRHVAIRSYSAVSLSKFKYHDLLLKNLPLENKDIDKVINVRKEKLLDIPVEKIIKNCKMLRDLKVELNPIENIAACLNLSSPVLKHRIFLLQEMGVPTVNTNLIYRVPLHMKIPASDFKKKSNIPMEQNIMINLLRHIDDKIIDPPPVELLDETLPLYMHFEKCFYFYAMRELGTNDIKLLNNRTRRYKSIRLMARMLKIFREEIGVDQEYLRKHVQISDMCPDEAENVLRSFKNIKVGTMTIHEAAKKKPLILQYDPENMKKLLQSIKTYGIDDKGVDNCLRCLDINNDVFVQKMEYLLSLPDLKVWCKSTRILYFMINEKTVENRINYLRKTGYIKWASVYLLTCTNQYFKRFQDDDFNYLHKRTYIKYILYKELGSDKPDIMTLLTRHPYWNRVSYVDMDYTLCSLKEQFSIEDICHNIHLILYRWSLVSTTLKNIQDSFEENQGYTSCQILALCLYLLEKENHFTGDGVWNLHMESRKQSMKEQIILESDILHRSNETLDTLNNKPSYRIDA